MLKIKYTKVALAITVAMFLFILPHVSAQIKTSCGDEVGTLQGFMKSYYDVISVKAGGKIVDLRDSLLHWPNARIGMILSKNDTPILQFVTIGEYHKIADPDMEKNGFSETEISRKVEHFGNMYHVWSTYESRAAEGGRLYARGINSISLYFDGNRFWITSEIFDSERRGNEIPAEYL